LILSTIFFIFGSILGGYIYLNKNLIKTNLKQNNIITNPEKENKKEVAGLIAEKTKEKIFSSEIEILEFAPSLNIIKSDIDKIYKNGDIIVIIPKNMQRLYAFIMRNENVVFEIAKYFDQTINTKGRIIQGKKNDINIYTYEIGGLKKISFLFEKDKMIISENINSILK
jgi:hypothetical protein